MGSKKIMWWVEELGKSERLVMYGANERATRTPALKRLGFASRPIGGDYLHTLGGYLMSARISLFLRVGSASLPTRLYVALPRFEEEEGVGYGNIL